MDENLPDIDKIFKAALEDFTESPPAFVWEGIAHAKSEDTSSPKAGDDEESHPQQ